MNQINIVSSLTEHSRVRFSNSNSDSLWLDPPHINILLAFQLRLWVYNEQSKMEQLTLRVQNSQLHYLEVSSLTLPSTFLLALCFLTILEQYCFHL